jgi:hypothetical protein
MADHLFPANFPDDPGFRKHLWTAEVYRAMAAGVFGGEPTDWLKMELIEGELVEKIPLSPPHCVALVLARTALMTAFPDGHYIGSQFPLHLDDYNEPEPDVMVIVGGVDDYKTHPTGTNARLVMEIADTTLRLDRAIKSRLYAYGGVTDYWILILRNRTLEVRRDPGIIDPATGEYGYRFLTTYSEADWVSPLHASQVSVAVADLLPDVPTVNDEAN